MRFTEEDVKAFKQLVADTKKDALVVAQFLVDAGVAKRKPEFRPKEALKK